MTTTWDEKKGRAISETERNLVSVIDEFTELGYVEAPKPPPTCQQKIDTSAPPVAQVDAASQDDISSFENSLLGGQRQTAPPQTVFAVNPSDDRSVAGRSVAAPVASLESRMTEIERRLDIIDHLEQILLRLDPKSKESQSQPDPDPSEHDGLPAPMDTSSQEADHNDAVGDSSTVTADGAPAH